MVSWWPGGGNADDIIGHNNGSPAGTVGFGTGKVGQAFSFDGSSGFENMGAPASLNLTTQVTLDGWINPNDPNHQAVYFGKASSGQNDYALFLLSGQLAACIKTSDATEHFVYSGFVPPAGQWTHIALTYNGSLEVIYANGVALVSQPVSGNLISEGISFSIGGRFGDAPVNSLYFNGLVDEVEVFNRALSASEIAAIYLADSAGKCHSCTPPPANLVG